MNSVIENDGRTLLDNNLVLTLSLQQKSKRNAKRKSRKRKLANPELMAFVLFNLSDSHWSPEAISEKSKTANLGETVSPKTIYNWIKKERRDCLLYLRSVSGQNRTSNFDRLRLGD